MKNAKIKNNNKIPKMQQQRPIANAGIFKGGSVDSLSSKIDRVLSRIPKGSFAAAGGALGGPVGAAAGAALSTISGYGDYVVSHNTIDRTGGVTATDIVPRFGGNGGVGSNVRITHREYIGDIKAPEGQGFNVTQYAITPTNDKLFPWLANFASKFQRFKINGMVFYYKSTSTDYNNSGIIAMTVNYDPSEEAYTTMQGMMNSKFAVSTKPSQHLAAPVECAPAESPQAGYFIEHSAQLTAAELRQTCKGMLNIATEGLSVDAGVSIGQLFVVYDIQLMYPYHSIASRPSVPFGSSAADVYGADDVPFANRQLQILGGFPAAPEDRLLYTSFDTTTTSPHRIDILGTPGHKKFKFTEAGRYFILCVYKGQTVAMSGSPLIDNGNVVGQRSTATIGEAETNKCGWARVVVDAAAGSTLTWFDTSFSGICEVNIFADKLS